MKNYNPVLEMCALILASLLAAAVLTVISGSAWADEVTTPPKPSDLCEYIGRVSEALETQKADKYQEEQIVQQLDQLNEQDKQETGEYCY